MKLSVIVRAQSQIETFGACIEVAEPFAKAFNSVDVCNDPVIRMATGSVSSSEYTELNKFREEAAKEISNALTRMLVKVMKERDTVGGSNNA